LIHVALIDLGIADAGDVKDSAAKIVSDTIQNLILYIYYPFN
jgi:hypothetical protein